MTQPPSGPWPPQPPHQPPYDGPPVPPPGPAPYAGPPMQPPKMANVPVVVGICAVVGLVVTGLLVWLVVGGLGDDEDCGSMAAMAAVAAEEGCGGPADEPGDDEPGDEEPTEEPTDEPTDEDPGDDEAAATAAVEGYIDALNEQDEEAGREHACEPDGVDFSTLPEGVTYQLVGVVVHGDSASATTKALGMGTPTTYIMPLKKQDAGWCVSG